MEFLLKDSFENQRPIKIFYIDRTEKISERIVRVEKMTDRYIQAYCYWRKEMRVFKRERILSAGPLRRKAGA